MLQRVMFNFPDDYIDIPPFGYIPWKKAVLPSPIDERPDYYPFEHLFENGQVV